MVSFYIEDLKKFMSLLLAGNLFDNWEMVEAKAETFCEFHVNGRVKKEFFDTEEREYLHEYTQWREVRPLFYEVIKGKKLPLTFSVVFIAPREWIEGEEKRLLQIRYTKQGCVLITGFSKTEFSLDKTKEQEWDEYVAKWLKEQGIVCLRSNY